jgi:hypothetical protein
MHLMGESKIPALKVRFDRRVRLEFRGATITSNAGLLAARVLDEASDKFGAFGLAFTEIATGHLKESRTGRNVQHPLVPPTRRGRVTAVSPGMGMPTTPRGTLLIWPHHCPNDGIYLTCMIKAKAQSILDYMLSLPIVAYVMLCFSVSYLLFFVRPVFFHRYQVMQFIQYVPAITPIGVDLKTMLSNTEAWATTGHTPYIGTNAYPPLATVLFTPLLFLDVSTAYRMVTLITLLSFALSTLLIPLWVSKERNPSSLLVLLFVTGVFSYGFQFELERGQFNVIAFLLSLLAVYIYHYHHKYRYVGYLLFSISIQLKIFPAIFIVMFVKDWRDWKGNLKRVLAISTCNFAALFILGPQVFNDFLSALKAHTLHPYVWIGNHSIKSFVLRNHYGLFAEVMLLAFVGMCILLIMLRAYRQNTVGMNQYLFLACTLGALLIPAASHDYKLSILPAAVAIALHNGSVNRDSQGKCLFSILLVAVISVAYSTTLFSYANKPIYLHNNLPALFAMLLALTVLSNIDSLVKRLRRC